MIQVRKACAPGRPSYYVVHSLNGRVLFALGQHSTVQQAISYWVDRAEAAEAAKDDARKEYADAVALTLSQYLSFRLR